MQVVPRPIIAILCQGIPIGKIVKFCVKNHKRTSLTILIDGAGALKLSTEVFINPLKAYFAVYYKLWIRRTPTQKPKAKKSDATTRLT